MATAAFANTNWDMLFRCYALLSNVIELHAEMGPGHVVLYANSTLKTAFI